MENDFLRVVPVYPNKKHVFLVHFFPNNKHKSKNRHCLRVCCNRCRREVGKAGYIGEFNSYICTRDDKSLLSKNDSERNSRLNVCFEMSSKKKFKKK